MERRLHDHGYRYPDIYDLTLIDLHRLMDGQQLATKMEKLSTPGVDGTGRYARLQKWKKEKAKRKKEAT